MRLKIFIAINKLFDDIRIIGLASVLLGFHLWLNPDASVSQYIVNELRISLNPLIWFMIFCGFVLMIDGETLPTWRAILLCVPIFSYMAFSLSAYTIDDSFAVFIRDFIIFLFAFSKRMRIITADLAKKLLGNFDENGLSVDKE